jgi:hypothetical protein
MILSATCIPSSPSKTIRNTRKGDLRLKPVAEMSQQVVFEREGLLDLPDNLSEETRTYRVRCVSPRLGFGPDVFPRFGNRRRWETAPLCISRYVVLVFSLKILRIHMLVVPPLTGMLSTWCPLMDAKYLVSTDEHQYLVSPSTWCPLMDTSIEPVCY